MNHSKTRTNARYRKHGAVAILEITRTIQPGEEVFVDYGRDFDHFTN